MQNSENFCKPNNNNNNNNNNNDDDDDDDDDNFRERHTKFLSIHLY